MRRTLMTLLPALAGSLTLAACGSSSGSSTSSPSASSSSQAVTAAASSAGTAGVVKTAANATLSSTVLVDASGLTLYRLSGEQNGKFICTSATCLATWHPLVAPAGASPAGSVGSLGTVKRPDGSRQVTYKGMPLYTFIEDRAPGQAKGQGLKDVGTWTAVATSAASSTTRSSPATPAASSSGSSEGSGGESSGGGGHGY